MGCCLNSRQELIEVLESSIFTPLELDLGLYHYTSMTVDKCILRHVQSSVLCQEQLQSIFGELKLKLSYNHKLFELFSEGGKWDTIKIRSLFLMLTKGSTKTKSSILFKIYNKKDSGRLESDEIRKMLNNFIDISCKIFPLYTTSLYPLNLEVKGYVRCLFLSAPIVLRQYTLVFCNEAKLTLNQLQALLMNGTSAYLLSIKLLRVHAYRLYSGTLNPIEEPIKSDSEMDAKTINSTSRTTRKKLVKLRKFTIHSSNHN